MSNEKNTRIKNYVELITKRHGGTEALLESKVFKTDGNESPQEEVAEATRQRLVVAKDALKDLSVGKNLAPGGLESIEAIIFEDLRPAVDIIGGKFQVVHPLWKHLNEDGMRTVIEKVICSVGRIELPGSRRAPYGGTGFVVGEGLIMTNRHVAELFASGLGDRRLSFIAGARAGIDFKQERGSTSPVVLEVIKVVMIHPYWDMALLKVKGLTADQPALQLATRDARELTGTQVAVIGYPAYDSRNPAAIQNKLFDGRFNYKRLQPGELHPGVDTSSFGKVVRAGAHDASTMGGNSGSAVIDLESGEVLGLHFGGSFHVINYCVPAFALAADPRVVDAGVKLAGDPPAKNPANDTQSWWSAADRNEQVVAQPDLPPAAATLAPLSVPAQQQAVHGSDVTVQIPLTLNLTVSVGLAGATPVALTSSVPVPARASAAMTTEAMREPEHDADYSSRQGYRDDFLGVDAAFQVPLPTPQDDTVLAPTFAGETLLHYQNFSVAMHAKRRLALFTASNVSREAALRRPDPAQPTTRASLSGLGKGDTEKWFLDPRMDARFQLPDVFFTKDRQAFDKGHLVRRDDVAWGATFAELKRANGDSYHVTNCSPQTGAFNQSAKGEDNWGDLENHVFTSAASERLSVLAGPVLDPKDEIFVGTGDNGSFIRTRIPSRYWKVIVNATLDGIAAYGFVLQQDLSDVRFEEIPVPDNLRPFLTRLSEIEEMSGIRFGDALTSADQFDSEAATEMVLRGAALVAPIAR